MAEGSGLRKSLPPLLLGLILLAFTVTGLAAGVGARRLVDVIALSGGSSPPGSGSLSGTVVPAKTPTPSPPAQPTVTVVAGGGATGFTLEPSVSPGVVASGKQFTVTVVVIAKDNVSRLSGVLCTLGPEPHTQSLFPAWPAPARSNSRGEVTWPLTAPAGSTGVYFLQVSATGSREYSYYADFSVDISG